MLRLGELQKGHMDLEVHLLATIPPSPRPRCLPWNTRRMSQKLAAKQGRNYAQSSGIWVKWGQNSPAKNPEMLKDTGYLYCIELKYIQKISFTLSIFPIYSPFKMAICMPSGWASTSYDEVNFQTCTDFPTDHQPTQIQAFSALRALERAWRITSMSLHIACRQLNPQQATSALKAVLVPSKSSAWGLLPCKHVITWAKLSKLDI